MGRIIYKGRSVSHIYLWVTIAFRQVLVAFTVLAAPPKGSPLNIRRATQAPPNWDKWECQGSDSAVLEKEQITVTPPAVKTEAATLL